MKLEVKKEFFSDKEHIPEIHNFGEEIEYCNGCDVIVMTDKEIEALQQNKVLWKTNGNYALMIARIYNED